MSKNVVWCKDFTREFVVKYAGCGVMWECSGAMKGLVKVVM